jgi:hypothetical protein
VKSESGRKAKKTELSELERRGSNKVVGGGGHRIGFVELHWEHLIRMKSCIAMEGVIELVFRRKKKSTKMNCTNFRTTTCEKLLQFIINTSNHN